MSDAPATAAASPPGSRPGGRRSALLLAAAAFVLVFGFRALYIPFALGADEGDYATATMQAFHGQSLYSDQHSARPPILYAYYGAALGLHDRLGWPIEVVVHVLGTLMAAASCAILAYFLARRYGIVSAACGTILASLLACSPGLQAVDSNAETLMLLPYTVAGLMLWRWARGEDVERPWLEGAAVGVLAVLAIMTKQVAGVLLGAVLLALVLRRRDTLRLVLGFLVSALGATLAVTGWVVATGQLRDWIVFGWIQNFLYSQNAAGPGRLALAVEGLGRLRGLVVLPVLVVTAAALIRRLGADRRFKADRMYSLGWLALSILPTTLSGFYFPHYFIQVLAPIGLVAALGADNMLAWRQRSSRPRLAACVAAVMLALAVGGPLYGAAKAALIYPQLPLPSDQTLLPSMGAWVRGLTRPSDRVLMWSGVRGLNVYADRMPANMVPEASLYTMRRFVIFGPSAGKSILGVPLVEPMDAIIAQWKADPPDAILVTTPAGTTFAQLASASGSRDDAGLERLLPAYHIIGRRRIGGLDAVLYTRN